jgi:DNA-directed RNA polymerase subunit RPC12/RpoP
VTRPLEIAFACSGCKTEVVSVGGAPATCAACGAVTTLDLTEALRRGEKVDACPACGGRQLYVQRDFNQKVGLAVVIVGAALAPFTPFYSSLIVAALIDAGLYAMLPEITVCYRCHAHFRGFARNPAHEAFDLHLAEQYETHERSDRA